MKPVEEYEVMQIGETVRDLRERRGWSQDTLAERSGLHRNTVASIEKASRRTRITSIYRILRPLGYALDVVIIPSSVKRQAPV